MPSPGQFKEGFKVHKGLQLGGWSLQHITMGHEVVQQNERYRFPTTMLFERGEGGGCGPKQLLHLLQEHVTGERVSLGHVSIEVWHYLWAIADEPVRCKCDRD